MGEKLKEFYDKAAELGGLKAKMRLSVLTSISSDDAEDEPDSPENISEFEDAMEEIRKEFG